MKRFVLVGVVLAALLAFASPAAASSTTCNSTLTGASVSGDLVVPENGACTITNSTVGDDVKVGKNAFFQSTGSTIGGDVKGSRAQTIFIEGSSTVNDDVTASKTAQVFIFDSTINGAIGVTGATDKVNVCGNTVDGRIQVKDSGTDILIGDPLTIGCAGNTVLNRHRIRVEDNFVDVELVIRGNTIQGGDLEVNDNKGPADKFVQNNKGGFELECHKNETPFTASGNTGFKRTEGQCAVAPTECTSALSGATIDGDLVVPDNATCTITGSTVGGDVKVGNNAFFEATGNSSIAGSVKARRSLTVFLDTGTTVGGKVDVSSTFQVFAFNSTVGGEIDVRGIGDKVNLCGNHVGDDLEVSTSSRDILVGDPQALDCAGNTVSGDIEIENNSNIDVELVVRGNTVGDDLSVRNNRGSADKFVQDNTGGDRLSCSGNEATFTGAPNSGFASTSGQCALI